MLIHRHKIVFVHIPKTAGSSIERALKPYRDTREILVRRVGAIQSTVGWRPGIRPLYVRTHALGSEYLEALGKDYTKYFSFAFVRNPFDLMVSNFHFLKARNETKGKSFREFLKDGPIPKKQKEFVTDQYGNQIVNFVGRFEALQKDFNIVAQKLNFPIFLPHINKSQHKQYLSYYDKETRQIVVQRFAEDFEYFGYSRDLETT